jgi:hypothetical protein
MKIELTYKIAHAAATDAGNRHAKQAGRVAWNADDYSVMVETFHKLHPCPTDAPCPVCDGLGITRREGYRIEKVHCSLGVEQ